MGSRVLENISKELDRHGLSLFIVCSPVGWKTHLGLIDKVLIFRRSDPGLARIGIVLVWAVFVMHSEENDRRKERMNEMMNDNEYHDQP